MTRRVLARAVVTSLAIAVTWATANRSAAVPPACDQGAVLHAPADCGTPGYVSRCTNTRYRNCYPEGPSGAGCYDGPADWSTYPLHVNLAMAVNAPDYPPRSLDPVACSLPLVAGETAEYRGPRRFRERPTHAGMVDLITGQPIVQETDFQLAFGSATFRHVRTYSEVAQNPPNLTPAVPGATALPLTQGAYWDWNGLGWMMGENALFVIDAAYAGQTQPGEQPRCYFMPDAHHAIPFLSNGAGGYQAPPWFDAYLDVATNAAGCPDEYTVWLQNRTVKYTIQPVFQDMPSIPEDGTTNRVSAHSWRADGAGGVPYYGLVKEIEDRAGNRIKNHYCSDVNTHTGADCATCSQNCLEKGQLKAVELFPTGSASPKYTLLYFYRGFVRTAMTHCSPDEWDQYTPHVLHSIYVYDHSAGAAVAIPAGCTTVPTATFCGVPTVSALDAIEDGSVPPGWVLRVKYLHGDGSACFDASTTGTPDDPMCLCSSPLRAATTVPYYDWPAGALLKATVTDRRSASGSSGTASTAPERTSHTLYRYQPEPAGAGDELELRSPVRLEQIIYDQSIRGMLTAAANQNSLLYEWINGVEGPNTWDIRFGDDPPTGAFKAPDYDHNGVPLGISLTSLLSLDPERLHALTTVVDWFEDRRASSATQGSAHLMLFAYAPSSMQHDPPDVVNTGAIYSHHYPYRYRDIDGNQQLVWSNLPADSATEPAYVAVIDEVYTSASGGSRCNSQNFVGYRPFSVPPTGLRNRRAVEINANGFVLRDRTWWSDGCGRLIQTGQTGRGNLSQYDGCGRLLKQMIGAAWSSDPNSTANDDILVRTFTYYPQPCPPAGNFGQGLGEVWEERIQRGINGTPALLRKWERTDPLRPGVVTAEIVYPLPGGAGERTEIQHTYAFRHDTDQKDYPCSGRKVIRPATQRGSALPAMHSIEQFIDDPAYENMFEWHGRGSAADPNNLTLAYEFYADYKHTAPYSSVALTHYVDVDASTADLGFEHPYFQHISTPWPSQWVRATPPGAASPPLHEITRFHYEWLGTGALRNIEYPNGRETWYAHGRDWGTGLDYKVTFNDLTYLTDQNGHNTGYRCATPGTIQCLEGSRMKWSKSVIWNIIDDNTPNMVIDDNILIVNQPGYYTEVATVEPQFDGSGKLSGLEVTDANSNVIGANLIYDPYGQIVRQAGADGGITRNAYDEFGRLLAVYKGTHDSSDFWGGDASTDNMVLVEKRRYGEGATDWGMLTEVRTYRDPVANQYYDGTAGVPANDEDQRGTVTYYTYDWRRREVVARRCGEQVPGQSAPVNSHSLTWYDNLDRPRFMAEYGQTAPASGGGSGFIHPVDVGADGVLPTAAAILTAAPAPLGLTEKIYNARGQVEQERRYNVASGASATFTATITYYDYADRPAEVIAPNQPTMKYVYDAKGRQIVSSAFAGAAEISRSETDYNSDDQAVVVRQFERRHNATGNALDSTNSIISYTHNWCDIAGRVIARADWGTNAPATTAAPTGTYTNGPVPTYNLHATDGPAAAAAAGAQVTRYEFDDAGRQWRTTHPDGTVTQTRFDNLGRTLLTIENATALQNTPPRVTAYRYDSSGRMDAIAAVMNPTGWQANPDGYQANWTAADGSLQVTQMVYGADVVDASSNAVQSVNPAFVREVRFPGGLTGQPDGTDVLSFTYYYDGQVASRTDSRGVVFTYRYDDFDRLSEVIADDSAWYGGGDADSNGTTDLEGFGPPDRVRRITFDYDTQGQLLNARAYTLDVTLGGATERLLTHNQYEYDLRNNLLRERQSHGSTVTTGTLAIDYEWAFQPFAAGNYNRLSRMHYPPVAAGAPRRTIDMGYSANAIGDAISRVAQVNDSVLGQLAGYGFAGSSRRVAMTLGNNVVKQNAISTDGYAGLDRFGRVIDQHYKNNATATIHRYEYGYDLSGNRKFARTTLAPFGGVSGANTRSHVYGYDALQRLIRSGNGQLTSDNVDVVLDGAIVPFINEWRLDLLGNWSGSSQTAGLKQTTNFDSDPALETRCITHMVDASNRIRSVVETPPGDCNTDVGPDPMDPPEVITPPGVSSAEPLRYLVYDPSGSLLTDGSYWYQYDAWNRLIQINQIGDLAFNRDSGRIEDGAPGPMIARYGYDGLGRLARRWSPAATNPTKTDVVDYYYDGVRRVSEHVTPGVGSGGGGFGFEVLHSPLDPTPTTGDAGTNGTSASGSTHTLIFQPLDENTNGTPDDLESLDANSNATGDLAEFGDANTDGTPDYPDADTNGTADLLELDANTDGTPDFAINAAGGLPPYVERQYIWGADYVDECVAQITRSGMVYFVLQDANYNVVGLVRGPGGGTTGGSPGTLLCQYTWSPYGELLKADQFQPMADNRLGHQGLFVERLDGTSLTLSLVLNTPETYYNRNRTYHPGLGRFLQKDPNGCGAALINLPSQLGGSISPSAQPAAMAALNAGTETSYVYAGSRPVSARDALGLDWEDYEDAIIDVYADRAAAATAVMDSVGMAFEYGAFIGEVALSMTSWGSDALLLRDLAAGDISLWEAIATAIPNHLAGRGGKAFQPPSHRLGSTGPLAKLASRWAIIAKKYKRLASRSFFGGPRDTYIYLGMREGEVVYVGITNNIIRRITEHDGKHGKLVLLNPNRPITRGQGRALEQAFILRYGLDALDNKINAISSVRAFYRDVVRFAQKYLDELEERL